MEIYKKEKLTNVLLIILISAAVSFLIFNLFSSREVTQTNTQTVNVTNEDTPKININEATKEELRLLPGIGEKTADKIINNRPYTSIYELVNIDGIGEKIFKQLEGRVRVE